MTKLTTQNIFEIGSALSEKLNELSVRDRCEIRFTVSEGDFRKIDEDLFYHYKKEGDDAEFTPADNGIKITFDGLLLTIEKEEKD